MKQGIDILNVDDVETAAKKGRADEMSYLRDTLWIGLVSVYILLCGVAAGAVFGFRSIRRAKSTRNGFFGRESSKIGRDSNASIRLKDSR